jgi:hypothetical protein
VASRGDGLFGTQQNFAPIHGSRFDSELVVLAVSKDQVKDAPNLRTPDIGRLFMQGLGGI